MTDVVRCEGIVDQIASRLLQMRSAIFPQGHPYEYSINADPSGLGPISLRFPDTTANVHSALEPGNLVSRSGNKVALLFWSYSGEDNRAISTLDGRSSYPFVLSLYSDRLIRSRLAYFYCMSRLSFLSGHEMDDGEGAYDPNLSVYFWTGRILIA